MNRKTTAKKNEKKKPQRKSTLDDLYKQVQESKAQAARDAASGVQPQQPAKKVTRKKSLFGGFGKTKKPTAKKPQQQSAAIPQGQRRTVNKAVNNAVSSSRSKSRKKSGSRGRNYSLYYIFGAVVAITVFAVLAKTVLFDCGAIIVNNNVKYTAEQVIEKSGIKLGTSLLDIDTEKAREAIIASLAYIDDAEVKKSYPTKIEINVKEAERWYIMKYGNRPFIVSRLGKIIDEGTDSTLPVVIGYQPVQPTVGTMLVSEEEGKNELPALVLSAAEEAELIGITSIDITDRFEITVIVEDRITLQLGISTQLENKLHIARELIENEISATEKVTVNLSNPEKVYVRDNNIIENQDEIPQLPPKETSESAETASE